MFKDITHLPITDKIDNVNFRLNQIENRFSDMMYNFKNIVQSEFKSNIKIAIQDQAIHSLHTAFCVETIDPLKQGRVRFFSPLMHEYEASIKSLPWALPISSQGGFDDCGCTWVPPAGSKLCLLFESGNRNMAYYIGTSWDRSRKNGWGITIPEYDRIHRGHRGGYLVGPDETQVFPPWNTENYNGNDIDSDMDFETDTYDPDSSKTTYPNIYGWKTPQKHMIKMVDGNYKCNFRWQRLEIKSSQGNHLIFKDDRIHPSAQWVHKECDGGGGDYSKCYKRTNYAEEDSFEPIEKLEKCKPTQFGDNTPVGQKVLMKGSGKGQAASEGGGEATPQGANPYFKHKSECRPYSGPKTMQNNKVDNTTLPQSGIQLTSISGHTFWMDDAVLEPRGTNKWEKGIEAFDYGCKDIYKGVSAWKSAHGHQIVLSEIEKEKKKRGDQNFIRLLSATGNRIELNDDTVGKCTAGPRRGIELQSTSNHIIQMIDENNKQCSPERREGGTPKNEATDAFVKIRTGYGLEIHMGDDNSQKKTQQQYIQIMAPQYDACCGAHFIRLQEDPNCGYIFVRAAGDYICATEGDHYTAVGVGESTGEFCEGGCLGPRNWFTAVSQHSLHYSCNFYFNKAEIHAFLADKLILLMAGKDCPPPPEEEQTDFNCIPCVGPVAVLISGQDGITRLKASDRVFASASALSQNISIFQLSPFVKTNEPCPPPCDCDNSNNTNN